MVYPGAKVGEGSVIGARALVNGTIPPNSVAVGVPAKVTRRDIVWDKRHLAIHAPHMFDDISTIPNPWQSQFPPFEAEERRSAGVIKSWLNKVTATTACLTAQVAIWPDMAGVAVAF
ncbi:acyltransferase [Sphingobium sp. S6]|nr:hypothetical protein [Sphingobium sp. S6]